MNQHPKWVEFMREQFPPGTRIRLTEMKDPYAPVPPGTEGTLELIDDQCQFHMAWDNGRTLALIPGEDRFSVIPQPIQTLKLYMPLTVTTYERNEWGDLEDEPVELDNRTALAYEDHILAAILKERMLDITKLAALTIPVAAAPRVPTCHNGPPCYLSLFTAGGRGVTVRRVV